jgi:glutaminase
VPSSMPGFGCFGKQTRKTTRVEVEFDGCAGGDFDNPLVDGREISGVGQQVHQQHGSSVKQRRAAKKQEKLQHRNSQKSDRQVPGHQAGEILKQGWLTKQGHRRKSWKRRWFVLWSRQQISYHSSPDAPPKGTISLDNAALSLDARASGRENCFGVFVSGYSASGHSERRLYLICAETPDEVSEWVRAIKKTASPSLLSQPLAPTTDALSVFELIGRARTLGITDKSLSAAMGRDDLVLLVNDALAKQARIPSTPKKVPIAMATTGDSSPFMSTMFESVDSVDDGEPSSEVAEVEKLRVNDPELCALWVGLAEADLQSARSGGILLTLEDHGLQPDDPRILLDVAMLQRQSVVSVKEFRHLVMGNVLIDRALHGRLAVSDFPSFRNEIEAIKLDTEPVDTGKVATYIPQLARVDPNQYGVAVCTIDGQQSFCGDYDVPFSVQSTMKPIAYAMALEEHGERAVHLKVGREPSGLNFNHRILNEDDLPHNPMINAGAIMVSSLIRPDLAVSDRFDVAMNIFTRLAGGRRPGFAQSTYLSEKATADRNFSLLYMIKEVGGFAEGTNVEESLDFYLMLCSIELDCRTMATVAGTLANGGVNPLTGDRIFNARAVRNTLSLMASCGM